ncbi:WD40-repeat-containing domain protein [Spinellus fusiger]|nr:WD40-repeat-containing domain protein [Spinellus fusiger]
MSSDEDDLDLNDDAPSPLDNGTDDGEAMDTEDPLPSAQNSPTPHQDTLSHICTQVQTQRRHLSLSPNTLTCHSYDCIPHAAAIHPNPIYSLAATRCFRWIFTGSEDGFIRKWDFFQSMNGKALLTQAQRHQHVESISLICANNGQAGVMSSWWEHEELPEIVPKTESGEGLQGEIAQGPTLEPKPSPVCSMDVHPEALWGLFGCDNGSINLSTLRHEEGKCHHVLRHHKGPVSVLKIMPSETGAISASWDRSVAEWDLHTGKIVRTYDGHSSQVACVAFQPLFTPHVPTPHVPTPHPKEEVMEIDPTDPSTSDTTANDPGLIWDQKNPNTMFTTSVDGQCLLWDRREPSKDARRLTLPDRTPPWCVSDKKKACWSADGSTIYVGRRNGTVDEWDFASLKHKKTFRMPANSGPVSFVTGMPNGKHLICASNDCIRLWDTSLDTFFTTWLERDETRKPSSTIPFIILPGHHGGCISQILVDATCRYMITTSGNRGWEGVSTNSCLFYDISPIIS